MTLFLLMTCPGPSEIFTWYVLFVYLPDPLLGKEVAKRLTALTHMKGGKAGPRGSQGQKLGKWEIGPKVDGVGGPEQGMQNSPPMQCAGIMSHSKLALIILNC
jgi:hypothetical protein